LIKALEEDKNVPYIIETMKRIGDASYDYLMDALQKGRKNVRRNAAQCLTLVMSQKYGYEGAIRLLATQLAGKNPAILEAVTQALLTLGTPSVRVLIEELIDDDLQLRRNAIEVLHYFGESNIEMSLDGLLDIDLTQVAKLGLILYIYYPSKELQDLGYSFAIKSGKLRSRDDEIFDLLAKSIREINPEIREKSCELLHHFGTKSVPILSSVLVDPNIQLRRKAVESLRKIKSKRALITLIKAAKDSDNTIAEISTRALGELKDPGVIDVIIENMKRPKRLVREAAIYAAVKIGPPIVKRLSKQLSSPNQNLTASIIDTLSQMESKTLELLLPDMKKADEKWFNNLKQIVEKMGKTAIKPLKKFFNKAKTQKTRERYFILLSLAKDLELIPILIKQIIDNSSKIAIVALNNFGNEAVDTIVDTLSKIKAQERKQFIENVRGLKAEILVRLLEESSRIKKLSPLIDLTLKTHTRSIRRYCQINQIKFNNFVDSLTSKE
jgi:HEAT repeat protein